MAIKRAVSAASVSSNGPAAQKRRQKEGAVNAVEHADSRIESQADQLLGCLVRKRAATAGVESLPDVVIVMVLLWLGGRDLCQAIPTARRLLTLTDDPLLWRTIPFAVSKCRTTYSSFQPVWAHLRMSLHVEHARILRIPSKSEKSTYLLLLGLSDQLEVVDLSAVRRVTVLWTVLLLIFGQERLPFSRLRVLMPPANRQRARACGHCLSQFCSPTLAGHVSLTWPRTCSANEGNCCRRLFPQFATRSGV